MTVYQVVPTVATSDAWSASQHNTYIRDNFKAIMENAVAGGMPYWSVTTGFASFGLGTTLGGLPYGNGTIPSILSKPSTRTAYLTMGTAGVPAWIAGGLMMAKGNVAVEPGGQTTNSTTFVDVTSCSFNLVLPSNGNTYTVNVRAHVTGYNDTAGAGFGLSASVGGVADAGSIFPFNGGASLARNEYMGYEYYVTGVAAGTVAVKLQFKATAGISSLYNARLYAFAYTE